MNASIKGQTQTMRRNQRRVYRLLWHVCLRGDGVCRLSLRALGDRVWLAPSCVQRHLRLLVQDGYVLDRTPGARRQPHEYLIAGKPLPEGEPYLPGDDA